jgi:hypothetical protein
MTARQLLKKASTLSSLEFLDKPQMRRDESLLVFANVEVERLRRSRLARQIKDRLLSE